MLLYLVGIYPFRDKKMSYCYMNNNKDAHPFLFSFERQFDFEVQWSKGPIQLSML